MCSVQDESTHVSSSITIKCITAHLGLHEEHITDTKTQEKLTHTNHRHNIYI